MAIKPANSNYHTFTFNGVRAADYGIYVTDVNVFNSAARDVEYIQIPGRDGAFALDRGRFQNISVVYKCVMTQDTDEDFATAISEFRNAIASTKGYKRLEDDIHTDEYRMGVFSKGLEAPTLNTKTATFDVEFNCKPQRFLLSGEVPVIIGGSVKNPQTESGAIVSVESDGTDKVASLVAQITPKQAGSGDPSPTNVRPITGTSTANVFVKPLNLFPNTLGVQSVTKNGVTFDITEENGFITDIYMHGTATAATALAFASADNPYNLPTGSLKMYLGGDRTTSNSRFDLNVRRAGSSSDIVATTGAVTITNTEPTQFNSAYIWVYAGAVLNHHVMPCIVPTDVDTSSYPKYPMHTGTTTTAALGRTVYGGTVDVVTGVLTVTHKMVDLGTLTWDYRTNSTKPYFTTDISDLPLKSVMRCSIYKQSTLLPNNASMPDYSMSNQAYFASSHNLIIVDSRYTDAASFKTAMNGVQLCYELTTPQTYNLTAQQVELLTGNNNVWADTGDITLTYGRDPNKIVNPTLFEAHPLLHLWGYGTINMLADDQDSQIVINNDPYGSVLLTNKVAKPSSQVSEFLNKSATELLNINDAVQVSAGSVMSIPFDSRVGTDINITNVSVSKTSTYDMDMSYVTARYGTYFIITFTLPQIDFVYSQTYQFKDSDVNVTVSYTQGGVSKTSSFPVRVHAQSTYSRTRDNISVGLFASIRTDGNDFFINEAKPISSTMQTIYGISTKGPFSNNEDSYIDLDIGEAYREVSGQTVSVNNAVTIPAQLPTLKCGANTITYDNTISQLEVVPRWWEV